MHYHKKNYFQGGVSENAEIQVHTIDYLWYWKQEQLIWCWHENNVKKVMGQLYGTSSCTQRACKFKTLVFKLLKWNFESIILYPPLCLQHHCLISSQSSFWQQHLMQQNTQQPNSRIGPRIAGSRYFSGKPSDLSGNEPPLAGPPAPCALLESRS